MTYQIFQLPKQTLIGSAAIKPSWKVSFFLTGTSTPTPVYTTSALSVAHTQPVQADSGGTLATIYLDPSIVYKASVYDQNDVLQYTVDPVNDSVLSQAAIGALLYPRTAAEISAAITPTNYAYPEGDFRRYGAVLDGTTDDTTAVQAAITVNLAGGAEAFFAAGSCKITGVTFASGVKVRGVGNKKSVFVIPSGTARTAFKAANTALFNDGAVFEDFGIIFANSADIGFDLSSVSRASLTRVRIWGDANQATRRGTGVLFDASIASCYANNLIDCDIRDNTKNLHFRKGANSNQVFGGQILNGTDTIYQEGTGGTDRIDNCTFHGARIETSYGRCVNITGDVWGWGFYGCRIEAYQVGSTAVKIAGGDATLPPTMLLGCTIAVSAGAVDYDFSTMTGRVLIWGQDANQYQGTTGSGSYHLGQKTIYIGNPSASGAAVLEAESSDTNADLQLTPKGTGAVATASVIRHNGMTITGATPTGTGAQVSIGNTVSSTVGAAGGASALPATPAGYLEIDVGGTKRKIPYYPV